MIEEGYFLPHSEDQTAFELNVRLQASEVRIAVLAVKEIKEAHLPWLEVQGIREGLCLAHKLYLAVAEQYPEPLNALIIEKINQMTMPAKSVSKALNSQREVNT